MMISQTGKQYQIPWWSSEVSQHVNVWVTVSFPEGAGTPSYTPEVTGVKMVAAGSNKLLP